MIFACVLLVSHEGTQALLVLQGGLDKRTEPCMLSAWLSKVFSMVNLLTTTKPAPARPEAFRGRPTGYDRVKGLAPERRLALDAYGRWLSQFPWDWWFTLTLRPHYKRFEVEVFHPAEVDVQGNFWPESTGVLELRPPLLCPAGVKRAKRGVKIFTKYVKRQLSYPHKLESFTVFQRQPHSRSIHVHGLAYGAGLEDVSRKETEGWCWDHVGKARIRPYNPALGARFYTAQHLFHQNALAYDIALSPGLSRSGSEEGSEQPPIVQAAQMDLGQRLTIDLAHACPALTPRVS